jgi:hypothetical protein
MDNNDARAIFGEMTSYRTYPDNIFVAPPHLEAQLRESLPGY